MKQPVIVVAGLGRCGSSLVMQMLDKAGVPTVGRFPAYEERGRAKPGEAVKWLDPLRSPQPFSRDQRAIVIWLDRDPNQQALSMVKMIGLGLATNVPPEATAAIRLSLGPDTKRSLAVVSHWTKLILRFEELIEQPRESADRIADFLNRYGFDVCAPVMAECVIPRPEGADCTPDLSIELALIGESAPDEVAAHMEALTGARV